MNIEFHYYVTYLAAVRAGFGVDEAQKIAYAAQYVDENTKQICIHKGMTGEYTTIQSQAFELNDMPADKAKQLKLYAAFHFIPGNPEDPRAARKDGRTHPLNTTPNGIYAQKILEQALKSDDPYRIGIAAHAYANTWTRQNFVGCKDGFNSTPGVDLQDSSLKWALHTPGSPTAVWVDPRLKEETVDNKSRCLEAAESLFWMLCAYRSRNLSPEKIEAMRSALIADLNAIWTQRDNNGAQAALRIRRYQDLSVRPEYGARRMDTFNKNLWFDAAVEKSTHAAGGGNAAGKTAAVEYDYFWKEFMERLSTDWFRFHEAVKIHQQETVALLAAAIPAFQSVLDGTDRPQKGVQAG